MFFVHDIIFIKEEKKEKENFFCNLCNFPLVSYLDFNAYQNYNCCENCYLTFIEGNKVNWNSGIRPSKEKIKEYINAKKNIKL
jgi:hypothetical protein